jgi:DNA-binding NarL/FixJ family response regulator
MVQGTEGPGKLKQTRILLADDHNVMRRGLRLLLESQPGFIVLDIAMPQLSGTEAAQRITESLPNTAIVILSMHSDESYVLRALKAGAKGYLVKDSAEGDLIEAIKVVSQGKAFFSPEVSRMLVEDYVREMRTRGVEDSYQLLTAREREILHLLAEGKSNKDIASLLNLSLFTVETHRRNLQEKLNLHSLAELILYAVRKGLIS